VPEALRGGPFRSGQVESRPRTDSRETSALTTLERIAAALFALALVAGACLLVFAYHGDGAFYDDAFITFQYARNWLDGVGFVYHSGEDRLATTSPAMALTIALLAWITGFGPLPIAAALSAAALAAAAWLAFRLVALDFGVPAGLAAGASLAVNPWLLSSYGGEWLVAGAWVLGGLVGYRQGHVVAAAACLAIATIFRTDAGLALVIMLSAVWWERRAGVRAAALTAVALGAIWMAVQWGLTGQVLPDTLGAKLAHARSGLFDSFLGGAYRAGRFYVLTDPWFWVLVGLAWHGSLLAALKGGVWRLLAAWLLAHTVFYYGLRLPFYHWYLVPIAIGVSLATGIGVAAVAGYVARLIGGSRPDSAPGRLAHVLGVTFALGLAAGALIAEARASRRWLVDKPNVIDRLYNDVGQWLAANTPETATVGYVEIGRIGYVARRTMVDQMGLVTPGAAEHLAEHDPLWAIHRYQPDYYLVNPIFDWVGSPESEAWFPAAYRPVASFPVPGRERPLVVYWRRPGAEIPPPLHAEAVQTRDGAVVGEIVAGTVYGQTFVASRDRLAQVALRLATFARANHGTITVRLRDRAAGDLMVERRIDVSEIADNAWHTFRFPPIASSAGRRFVIELSSPDAGPGNAVTVWYAPFDAYPDGTRLVDGHEVPGDLTLRLFYE